MAPPLHRPPSAHRRVILLSAAAATLALGSIVACSTNGGGGGGTGGTGGAGSGSGGTGSGSGGTPNGAGGTPNGSGGTPNGSGGTPNGTGGDSSSGGTSGSGGTGTGGAPAACDASAAPPIDGLGYETVVEADDLNAVVFAAQPKDSEDWYLVDAMGIVRVFSGGTLQAEPFLDVSDEVQDSGFAGSVPSGGASNYDERGLLSIAFAPDYQTSGKFYVTLIPTTLASDNTDHDLILEYTRSAGNPLVADPASRKAILDLEPGNTGGGTPVYMEGTGFNYSKMHNASTAIFGPDGMLYVGLGDGGGECNSARPGAPQDVTVPYGKILRLDPSQPAPYAAAGNPFIGAGEDPRIWHLGVRNPCRFSFDPANGDLYIGEVGQWQHDSLHFAPSGSMGMNFGWPAFEGSQENPSGQCASTVDIRAGDTRTPPIFDLAHGAEGGVSNLVVAIIGGAVYRGSAIPELQGAYLFAEFYPNRPMRALYQCGSQTSEITQIDKICDPNTPDVPCFVPIGDAPDLRQVGAIVRGNDGELYMPANGNALLKIVPAP
jgi:glucose/arabinose dehydrogenase